MVEFNSTVGTERVINYVFAAETQISSTPSDPFKGRERAKEMDDDRVHGSDETQSCDKENSRTLIDNLERLGDPKGML